MKITVYFFIDLRHTSRVEGDMTNMRKQKYPTKHQLSLAGLAADNPEAAYTTDLAVLRLRRMAKTLPGGEIPYHEATRIADSDLLNTLHVWGRIKCCREASPWVVYPR